MYICIIYYIYIIYIFNTGYTLYSPGWSITDCVAKTILKLTVILLLHVPESQVYRCVPLPCLTQTGFFFFQNVSFLPDLAGLCPMESFLSPNSGVCIVLAIMEQRKESEAPLVMSVEKLSKFLPFLPQFPPSQDSKE